MVLRNANPKKWLKRDLWSLDEGIFLILGKEPQSAPVYMRSLRKDDPSFARLYEEYLEAANDNDLVEVADALGDMLYILCGTIIEHGLQYKIEEVFEEIQRSNMSKLGEDGEPIYREDGKVLKGPNYFKPNIKEILES